MFRERKYKRQVSSACVSGRAGKRFLTLEQIARVCGYSNEIHFYRQFKAKTGMTPREYQASLGMRLRTGKDSMYMHDIPL